MKRSIWFSFFLSVLTVMLLTGCDTRRDDNNVDDRTVVTDDNNKDNTEIGKDAERDMLFENNRDYTYEERDIFKSDVDKAMDRIDDRIDMLDDKIGDAAETQKAAYETRIKAIKDKRDNLEKRMDDFDEMKDNNWNQFKSSFRTAWMDLKNDVDKASKDLGIETMNNDNINKEY